MPKSCKSILDRMVYKGAMTEAERDKILRNVKLDWIPVTERLPEKGGLYFVTKENDYGKYVATEWFYRNNNTWSTGWKVTAWMPMPETIRGE